MATPRQPINQRLEKYTVRTNSCWNWIGVKSPAGYGRIRDDGPSRTFLLAHRVAYAKYVGPIPEGLEIDHLCFNTSCINPEHLEAVTPAVNQQRRVAKLRARPKAARCIRGHEWNETNTTMRVNGWRYCKACIREIKRIKRKKLEGDQNVAR